MIWCKELLDPLTPEMLESWAKLHGNVFTPQDILDCPLLPLFALEDPGRIEPLLVWCHRRQAVLSYKHEIRQPTYPAYLTSLSRKGHVRLRRMLSRTPLPGTGTSYIHSQKSNLSIRETDLPEEVPSHLFYYRGNDRIAAWKPQTPPLYQGPNMYRIAGKR